MKNHQKSKHSDMEYKILRIGCSKCKLNIQHNCSLKISGGKLNCNECDYSTNWQQNLRKHYDSKHLNILRFQCKNSIQLLH